VFAYWLQPETIANEDQDNPRIKALTEEAREAHWKLTAPKGFATLKVREHGSG
jgi:hypothetical protein